MSKAFVKEDDGEGTEGDQEAESSQTSLPKGAKNYITPEGAQKLRDELQNLLNIERPRLVETISWAASNGDRSENGDYIYGKRRLREIDRRIRFLSRRLEIAEIVRRPQKTDVILFGASVRVRNEEGDIKSLRIVGIDETEVSKGWISWISPMGKALLQSKKNDVVTVKTPQGDLEFEIVDFNYDQF